ncbi:MAG: glycosyltransferase [Bacteroidales bacterium]|nr:glycosyltransferase [Bacteroidales bacterium]
MKIIILGTAYPFRGGLAAFNERLARQFAAEGHEVEIFTFTLQYPGFLFPGKTQYSDAPAPADIRIRRVLNSCNPLSWIKVGRTVRRMAPDRLVIKFWLPFMAPCLGTVARMARRNGRTRVVSVLDNIIPHEKRPGDRLFARYFARSVDGFVAMSQSVLGDTLQFDSHKPKIFCRHPLYDHYGAVAPRGEALARLGLSEENRYLLFFGLIRDYKGLDLLLEAMADSRVAQLGVKLIVAGEFYGDGAAYLQQAERLGLGDRVVWRTEFVPDNMVQHFFNAADLVVQPYKSATQSGVTQIAYHFGKPMVVTDVGGLAEMVPDGKAGYVVEPLPGAIAAAISDFYGRRPDFSATIEEEKRKYSWALMSEAILNKPFEI